MSELAVESSVELAMRLKDLTSLVGTVCQSDEKASILQEPRHVAQRRTSEVKCPGLAELEV